MSLTHTSTTKNKNTIQKRKHSDAHETTPSQIPHKPRKSRSKNPTLEAAIMEVMITKKAPKLDNTEKEQFTEEEEEVEIYIEEELMEGEK